MKKTYSAISRFCIGFPMHLLFTKKQIRISRIRKFIIALGFAGLIISNPLFSQVNLQNNKIKKKAKPPVVKNIDKIGSVRVAVERIRLTSPLDQTMDLSTNVTLNWQQFNDPQGNTVKYNVYLGINPNQLPKVSTSQGTTSYNATALTTNAYYYWKIEAVKSNGDKINSATWSFHVHNSSADIVNLISPVNMATNVPLNCTLSWQETIDPDGNQIVYDVFLNTEWVWVHDKNQHARISDNQTATSVQHSITAGEKYYWKVYAVDNRGGATESEIRSFIADPVGWPTPVTTGSFTDLRDNKTYQTVTIGNQTWMSENLAYLPEVNISPNTVLPDYPHYFVYGYIGDNVSEAKATATYQTYGVLYNVAALSGACPGGWHVPTDDEWKQLESYLGMPQEELDSPGFDRGKIVAGTLREAGTAHWIGSNPQVNNASGFNALPGGFRNNLSGIQMGYNASWWSGTRFSPTEVYMRQLNYNSGTDEQNLFRIKWNENYGLSVRCVRD
jgi:uncharacterized protein (TIGR02145 family)